MAYIIAMLLFMHGCTKDSDGTKLSFELTYANRIRFK
jgi:hypothetical protein